MPRTIRLSILSLALTALLAGCASPPQSLSELPRTPQASAEKILADADKYSGAEANLMRLYAAQAASEHMPKREHWLPGSLTRKRPPCCAFTVLS